MDEDIKKQRPTLCFHVSCLTLSFVFSVVIFLSVFLVLVSVLCRQGRFPNQLLQVNFETWFSIIIVLLGVFFSTCVKCPFPCLFIYSMGLEMRDIYAAGKSWSHVNKPEGDRITLLLPSVSVHIMVW